MRLSEITVCSVVEDLYSRFSVKRVLVEGGGRTVWSFVKEDCFDELRVTVSPVVFGSGRNSVEGVGFNEGKRLRLKAFEPCECGQEIHLIYEKEKKGIDLGQFKRPSPGSP